MARKTPKLVSFASVKHFDYPDFLDIQLKSFKDFFQLETNSENRVNEGLYKVFSENFPITDARNNFVLELYLFLTLKGLLITFNKSFLLTYFYLRRKLQ